MSTVYLQVGQCGIQVGKEYWKDAITLAQNDKHVKHTHFTSSGPQCLFIDAERKVIQRFIDETKKSKLLKNLHVAKNSIRCRKGCGSNWAVGYNCLGSQKMGNDIPKLEAGFGQFLVDFDSTMLEVCTEAIRTKVEACDSFSGFLCVNSLAGGTGSGWGTRLCVELSDMYPTAYRLWNVVLPHKDGESPTQNYNQLLSLAKLQECADAIILLPNDHILHLVEHHIRSVNGCSIVDMNKMISNILRSFYFPISSLTSRVGGMSIGIEPWEMIRSVAPLPTQKFLQTSYAQSSSQEAAPLVWDKLCSRALSLTRESRIPSDVCSSVLCVVRGLEMNSAPDVARISNKIKSSLHCVKWNPFPLDVWLDEPGKTSDFQRNSKSLSLCYNCSSSGRYLQKVYEKAQLMFNSRAYVHWYAKHGVIDENFVQAFDTLAGTIEEYKQL